jgi:PAS domain S-box-containing protein
MGQTTYFPLQTSLEPFRHMADSFPQIAWITEKDNSHAYFNPQWFEYTGFDPLSWDPNKDPFSVVHPDDLGKVVELWKQAIEGIKAFDIEYRLRRKDGVYRWHLGKLVPAKDSAGNLLRFYGTATDIHEQVEGRKKLEESETLFQNFVDIIPLMAWITDIATNKIYYNEQWHKDSGLSKSEGPFHWEDLIHPDDLDDLLVKYEKVVTAGEDVEFEFRFRMADGNYKWHLGKLVGLKDSSGKIVKRLGTATDIDQQKRREEKFYRLLMEAPAFVIIYRGSQHYIDFMNGVALKRIGNLDYVGKTYAEIFEADKNLQANLDLLTSVYSSGKVYVAAAHPMTVDWSKNGNPVTRYYNTVMQPTYDDKGSISGVMSFSIDVTKAIEVKNTIENQSKWLETILDTIPITLSFLEPGSGNILFTNNAGNRLAGHKIPKNMSAHEYQQIFQPINANGGVIPIEKRLSTRIAQREMVKDEPIILRTPAGQFNLIVAADTLPAMYGHPETTVLTFQDVTRLKQIESELQTAVRAREELMSICGHEFKTPLSTLRLQTQVAMRRVAKGDDSVFEPVNVKNRLRNDAAQIDRLVRLVEDMLDTTTLNGGHLQLNLESLNLSALVEGVIQSFSDQLRVAGCQVTTSLPAEVRGTWDRFRLEQALSNLLTNAMKYGKSKPISVSVIKKGLTVLVSVQDHGIGIAKQDHERIFERFERAISAIEVSGLGLGLFIVKSIVSAHRGTISLESAVGQGSRFTVELPLFGVQND